MQLFDEGAPRFSSRNYAFHNGSEADPHPLRAVSESGATEFTDLVHPGRYEESVEHGEMLANVREERFDVERSFAAANGHARLLTAGTLFKLDHNIAKFNGTYLVTEVHHRGIQRHFVSDDKSPNEPYRQRLQPNRCGSATEVAPSYFRPARLTPKPRIYGTQTAVVTADPADGEALHPSRRSRKREPHKAWHRHPADRGERRKTRGHAAPKELGCLKVARSRFRA